VWRKGEMKRGKEGVKCFRETEVRPREFPKGKVGERELGRKLFMGNS
jgi:hypothetical protein